MKRYFVPLFAVALAFSAFVMAVSQADAGHRQRHAKSHLGAQAVYVPARRVAAFRRAFVDRRIGPSGSWLDKHRFYYRPYHHWRGPLVYKRNDVARRHAHARGRVFLCKHKKHGVACRERL
jgi:hypothetical protein